MKEFRIVLTLCLGIIVLMVISGCVAPPKESLSNGTYTPTGAMTGTTLPLTTSPVYVTTVTPYMTQVSTDVGVTETSGYSRFTTQTPILEERSCRIFTTKQAFSYNGTAFTFNLKNPPMYINYSVIPLYVTEIKPLTHSTNKTAYTLTHTSYDPQSYLEITVRDQASGEIYLQDGFGRDYSSYHNRTLKVLNQNDLLIEIKGNKINGTINFWVKPVGNFDNPENMTFDACTYWGQSTRDNTALAYETAAITTKETYNSAVPTATPRPVTTERTVTPWPTHTAAPSTGS
jgi:hypothetical protein